MEEIKKIPDIQARQLYFLLTQKVSNSSEIEQKLIQIIKENGNQLH